MLVNTGRYRELPSWRKAFKRAWKKAAETPITLPLNEKYRPDAHKWVCTCPSFSTSRFLICKHLVQAVHAVPPYFFLEVKRNRTTPFWTHKSLTPLDDHLPSSTDTGRISSSADRTEIDIGDLDHSNINISVNQDNDSDDDIDGDEELIDADETGLLGNGLTCRERLLAHIRTLQDFCSGLEYQLQFNDPRMLDSLEKGGAGMLRLAQSCLSRERRFNSTRGDSPTTWEKETSAALFYRSRPRQADSHT
jgi:hypothetical protein